MVRKSPKGYGYTGRYSWSKERAEELAEKARTRGYSVKVVKAKSTRVGRTGFALFARTTEKGYGWKKKKKGIDN